jgi:hypothetical protein
MKMGPPWCGHQLFIDVVQCPILTENTSMHNLLLSVGHISRFSFVFGLHNVHIMKNNQIFIGY